MRYVAAAHPGQPVVPDRRRPHRPRGRVASWMVCGVGVPARRAGFACGALAAWRHSTAWFRACVAADCLAQRICGARGPSPGVRRCGVRQSHCCRACAPAQPPPSWRIHVCLYALSTGARGWRWPPRATPLHFAHCGSRSAANRTTAPVSLPRHVRAWNPGIMELNQSMLCFTYHFHSDGFASSCFYLLFSCL